MKAKKILLLFIAALMVFSASSCNEKESEAEGYNGVWYYDSEYHWRDPDENGDNWKDKHNFVNDVCHLCGYSRKTGTVDPGATKPSDGTGSSSGEGEPDIDDSKPMHDEFGIGETVVGEDGFSYTVVFGNDSSATYSIGIGNHKGLTTLDIPATFKGVAVTAIDDYGFKNEKSLTTVHIPESVKVIGYEAFAHCTSLQEIVIPNSVTFMDHRAFLECSSLKKVTLSNQLKNLYARTFYRCALEEVKFPEGLEYVAKSCFSQCLSLKTLYVSSTIKSLDGEAFFHCPITKVVAHNLKDWMAIDFSGSPLIKGGDLYFNETGEEVLLTKVDLPEGTERIKKFVFNNCSSLESVTIPDSVTEIGIRAFEGCDKLKEIKANGVKVVEDQTFQSMKGLETVSLMGAETLEREVFFMCSNLKEVHLGAGLHSIGQRCFVETALKDIYFDGTQEEWDSIGKFGMLGNTGAGDCWNYGLGKYNVHLKDNITIEEEGAVYKG